MDKTGLVEPDNVNLISDLDHKSDTLNNKTMNNLSTGHNQVGVQTDPKQTEKELQWRWQAEERNLDRSYTRQSTLMTSSAFIFGLMGSTAALVSTSSTAAKILFITSLGVAVIFSAWMYMTQFLPFIHSLKGDQLKTAFMQGRVTKHEVEECYKQAQDPTNGGEFEYGFLSYKVAKLRAESGHITLMNYSFALYISIAIVTFTVGLALALFYQK